MRLTEIQKAIEELAPRGKRATSRLALTDMILLRNVSGLRLLGFQLHPDARDELREAVLFYGRVAERLVNAVEMAIAAIILKPDQGYLSEWPQKTPAPEIMAGSR